MNTDDRDAVAYLKYFTFLDQPTIEALDAATKAAPEKREAQRVLARDVTRLVHGGCWCCEKGRSSTIWFG